MKRLDVPSIVLMIFAVLNIIAISWIVSFRTYFTQRTFYLLLAAIVALTVTMISLGELYEYLIIENKRLRVAIVAILRIATFGMSVLGILGSIFMFIYGITFPILFSRQILEFPVGFLIGGLYVPLLFVFYTIFTFIAMILMGSYDYKSPLYYRIQDFAITITQKNFMEKYHNCLRVWALHVPDTQALELFKSVVTILHYAGNELDVIAKPFVVIYPAQIDQFKEYVELRVRKNKELAKQFIQAIENQITKITENAEALEFLKSLGPQRNDIELVRPLIDKKKIVPVETVTEQTNLSVEQIEEACKYIDREVFEGNILTNVQYLRKLQKVL